MSDSDNDFWPEGTQERPGMKFVLTFLVMPLLLLFVGYAYVKTILFARNTLIFYRRFNKKDEDGKFEIPTKNVKKRRQG